jgi:hypothetical protein
MVNKIQTLAGCIKSLNDLFVYKIVKARLLKRGLCKTALPGARSFTYLAYEIKMS